MSEHDEEQLPPASTQQQPPPRRGLPQGTGETRTATLSNGATATSRQVMGNDLILAQSMIPDGANNVVAQMALVAVVTTVDGASFPWEDLKTTPAADVQILMELAVGNAPSPAPAT